MALEKTVLDAAVVRVVALERPVLDMAAVVLCCNDSVWMRRKEQENLLMNY